MNKYQEDAFKKVIPNYLTKFEKKEKTVEISYLGIAYFLHKIFIKYLKR